MKKLSIIAVIAIAAATFVGCGNSVPKADLKSDVDTLSYAIGLAQTEGLRDYLVGRMGVDTAYVDEFIKGFNEGVSAGDNKKQKAYLAGLQIGQQVGGDMIPNINRSIFGEDSLKSISKDNFIAAFITGALGEKGLMNTQDAQQLVQKKVEAIQTAEAEKKYGKEKKASEAAMAKVAKEPGVKKLANGVYYKVIKEGNGEKPTETSNVKLNYEGRLLANDTIFDSSYERKEPQTMNVGQVVPGFREALKNMPVGSTWEVYIPQEQGYGYRGAGEKIPAFSALKFKIELLSIEKAPEQPQMQVMPQGQPAKAEPVKAEKEEKAEKKH